MTIPSLVRTGLCLLAAGAQAQSVLNLSHDLVAKGIAAHNMVPDSPAADARPLFEAGVLYASKNHIPTVTADRGSYYFLTQNNPRGHAVLNSISNVAVDLQYSDIYCAQGQIVCIQTNNSTNITLKNFTVDYLQLPFTQVTVTGVDAPSKTIRIKQLGNYPLPSFFNSVTIPPAYIVSGLFMFAFRNGQQLRTTGRMQTVMPLSDASLQVSGTLDWEQSSNVASIQPGDTIVLTYRAGIASVLLNNCTGCTVQNVSVFASGFGGVFSLYGISVTIDHVQVMPRPGTDRLISSNADGIHLTRAGVNNVITNNTVRRGCDDAIAIDGQWSAIVAAPNSGAAVQVSRNSNAPLTVGAAYDFINIKDATTAGTATILSESPAPANQTGQPGELITLTLDHAIALQTNFGVTPSDPNLRGSGTVIRENLVQEEVFARGIYPAGVANVTISDNMIESTNGPGVLIEQDEALTYDYKTGPSSGITVKNNIIDHPVGYGVPGLQLSVAAAGINIWAYDQNFAWVTTSSLSNISVTGNFITNSIRSGIRMENVAGGQISGNTILNYGSDTSDFLWYLPSCCETLAQVQSDFAQPVVVAASNSVTNTSNTTTGPWIANVSYAASGYHLAPESIAVAYIHGQDFTSSFVPTPVQPVPTTLGGLTVTVKDSAGVSRQGGIYYVSSGAVCYVVPKGTANGVATVTIGNTVSPAFIGSTAPEIATASGTGSGVPIAGAVLASADGTQTPVPVYSCGSSGCVPVPMDLGSPTDTLVLVLYGTGIRNKSDLANVTAQIGGVPAQVAYAGANVAYSGFDQVNVVVPRALAGAGNVPVILTVDGVTANVVTINVK